MFLGSLIIIPGMLQERLVAKGFLVDRWMLRTAGWRSLQRRGCSRQEIRLRPYHGDQECLAAPHLPREEHGVEGDGRRHDRAKTFIAWRAFMSLHTCFLHYRCWEVSRFFSYNFQPDFPQHFG